MIKIVIDTKFVGHPESQVGSFKIGPYWEFTRPHTIIGTTITVITMFLITIGNVFAISEEDVILLLLTLISSLLANVYIVGLNQYYDVEIDKVNKPYLPLASGDLTFKSARIIIASSAILSMLLAVIVSIWLLLVVVTGMGIGTFYSIPLTRYKGNPAIAAFSIAFVRGVLGNIGLYLSYSSVLSSVKNIFPIIVFLTIYVLVFSLVIALFKDIPDLEGDKKYNIMTLTVRMGRKSVFDLTIIMLVMNYSFAIITGVFISGIWNQLLMVGLHIIILAVFYRRTKKVDMADRIDLWKFYKKIWHFFYLEYIVLIFVVLL